VRKRIFRKNPDKLREELNITPGGGGAFTDLSDVPASYSGQATKVVRVNAGATGLEFATVSGTGDVVGPGSSINDRVVFFDGLTGKLIKDSGLTLSGSNTGDNATNTQYSGLAASKQDTLVSSTNIKTINSSSILGAGNLAVGDMVLNTSQTVTAKKLFQHTMLEIGDDDASHRYIVMGGNISADRLVYFPNLTGNDTWVFLDQSQALTNKSVNGVTLTAAGVSTKYLNEAGTYTTPAGGSGLSQGQANALHLGHAMV